MARSIWLSFAAVAGFAVLPAGAHHALLVDFDVETEITVSGTVTERMLGNPHIFIRLAVEGAEGEELWLAEGGPHATLLRHGWTGNELAVGDRVRAVGYPARDGSHLMHWRSLYLADGKEIWGEPKLRRLAPAVSDTVATPSR